MPEDSRKVFQKNLQYYMQAQHKNQQDIVNALGVSKSTVSDWCHGKNYPRIDVMQRLADFFGVVMNNLTIATDHTSEITEDEQSLIVAYRILPAAGKEYIHQQLVAAKLMFGEKPQDVSDEAVR